MIERIQIGKKYNLIGQGNWGDVNMDVVVLGATIYSQIDPQEIPLYDDWFKDYEIDGATYENMMRDNPYIYHCRKLVSRDLAIESNDGEEIYIFPGMIDFQQSEPLVESKILKFNVICAPFKESDPLFPLKRITDSDIRQKLTNLMKDLTYDGVTVRDSDQDILVTTSEYQTLTEMRQAEMAKQTTQTSQEENAIAEERAYMYNLIETNEETAQKLRMREEALDALQANINEIQTNAYALRDSINYKELVIKNKYANLRQHVNAYNETVPQSDRINLPDYADL